MDAAGIARVPTASAALPSIPLISLRISIARPFGAQNSLMILGQNH